MYGVTVLTCVLLLVVSNAAFRENDILKNIWKNVVHQRLPSAKPKTGLTLKISQPGLNYAADVAIDQLSHDVRGKSLPDQHGNDHLPVGKVTYDITQLKITRFAKPSSQVAVRSGSGITWSVRNAGISLTGHWHYEYRLGFIKIRDGGSFDVSVSGASITVGITMGKSDDGHPTISCKSCSSNVNSVSVKFHGGASWLYNLFRHNVERPIKDKVKELLCSSAKKGINVDAEKALARMKVQLPIDHSPLVVDYSLLTSPVFGSGYVQSEHKGEFFWAKDRTEAPVQSPPIAQPPAAHKMVTICLSDYVTNTLGYILNKHDFLKYIMTSKDLPPDQRGFLNTTCSGGPCMGGFVKALGKKFPKSSVELFMQTHPSPVLHTVPKDVTGEFSGNVTFNVRLPNNTVVLGFSTYTTANVSLSGQIALNDSNRITAKVKNIKFHMKVIKSNVGPISDAYLNTIFGFAIKMFIIPQMNAKGKTGFKIPAIDVVRFVNPELYILQNTICFATDAKYTPK